MAGAMGRLLVGLSLAGALALALLLWANAERGDPSRAAGPPVETRAIVSAPVELVVPELPPAPAVPAGEGVASAAGEQRQPVAAARRSGDLVVKVVDPGGRPIAGIALRLDPGSNDLAPHELRAVERAGAALTTDSDGRAVFEGLRTVLESATEPWTLRHEIPFEPPPVLVLDRAALSGGEVVSVLPHGGSIEVLVRQLDGAQVPEGTLVELALVPSGEEQDPVLSGKASKWSAPTREGRALFPWVELARTWEAIVWRPDSTLPSRSRTQGPWKPYEPVQIEIVLGADHPVVRFRALDELGQPLSRASLELEMQGFGPWGNQVTTDEEGRFQVDLNSTQGYERGIVVLNRRGEGVVHSGRTVLPEPLQLGWNDGGDVVLAEEPLLVAGQVVDEAGRPASGSYLIAGADLQEVEPAADPEDRTGFNLRLRSRRVRGKADERGGFELRGTLLDDGFSLRAEVGTSRSETVQVERGQDGVLLVLSPCWKVSGRLLIDPEISYLGVIPRIRPRNVARGRPFVGISEDGHFDFSRVRAGTYDLSCSLGPSGRELRLLEGIVVAGDTDVGTIDLRGCIHRCEIVLVGGEDPDQVQGQVSWRASASEQEWSKRYFNQGSVELLTDQVPIDVQVRPRGYRHALLERLSGRREVVLEPPLRIRLVLHTQGEFPPAPYTLSCDLRQDGTQVGDAEGSSHFSAENRELAFRVSASGRLSVHWRLERFREEHRRFEGETFTTRGSIIGDVLQGHEVEIDVLDVPGEQVFTIDLDGQALTRLANQPPW